MCYELRVLWISNSKIINTPAVSNTLAWTATDRVVRPLWVIYRREMSATDRRRPASDEQDRHKSLPGQAAGGNFARADRDSNLHSLQSVTIWQWRHVRPTQQHELCQRFVIVFTGRGYITFNHPATIQMLIELTYDKRPEISQHRCIFFISQIICYCHVSLANISM